MLTSSAVLTSYHNHTTWSDGGPTVAAQIQAARRAGLDELGISDHYVLLPNYEASEQGKPVEWSMSLELLGDYVLELRAAALETRGLTVRLGIEADYFPATVAELRRRLEPYPFDFVIGSVHFADGFPLDEDAKLWDALSERERNEKWRRYWSLIREMAESRVFDFAAHLDLPKRFGHRPTVDLSQEEDAALDALAASDMAVEINTSGWIYPAREAYPSPALLRKLRDRGIPILINADAHFPEFLTRDFDRGRDLARAAGYTEVVRYERRRRLVEPL